MAKYLVILTVAVVGAIGGSFVDRSTTDILVATLWLAFLCQTWNIVGGMAGQFSFAHPVYVAVGGYTSTALFHYFGISPWIGMLAGSVLSVVISVVLAWVNFRQNLPLLTYALITLAVTFIWVICLRSVESLGGHEGLHIIRGNDPMTFRFLDRRMYFYIILAAVCGMLVISTLILRSNFGRKLIAIRDNQDAARMLGVNVVRMTVISSMISAGLGAWGGTFFAQYLSVIDPSVAGVELAVQLVLLTAVGGIGTVWGPVLGPLVLIPLERVLDREFVVVAGLGHLFYGVVIILILLVLRDGVVTWAAKRLRGRKMRASTRAPVDPHLD